MEFFSATLQTKFLRPSERIFLLVLHHAPPQVINGQPLNCNVTVVNPQLITLCIRDIIVLTGAVVDIQSRHSVISGNI